MKKNTFTFILLLIIGLVAGALVGQLLAPVPGLSFLTKSVELAWEPRADLLVLKYDFHIQLKLNLISLLGLAASFWIYRKL
ncbi:DUF4321 domain-containing protein [Paenibacillus doosanensis]|uniref:DUF4321 domain-containing protein n=1 Tax=Paenibacillus konkukensis TaxID=2020716 RepID=A0ABY4RVQ0_9BACL|nr:MULTISPECIES: DUF4321 domain-containing protein [Paenibacillus]MCS7458729.1 DUF4321 domain-containing protein [Paenibacillus doosanensis]UQZ86746.1 hypothetical protein SK3146_06039 [Paenibacillus konkukensis]